MDTLEHYLQEHKFNKRLEKLSKKLKNKKVVIYGTGSLFETIVSTYDLSGLNIIAVSDGKYTEKDCKEVQYGYKKIVPADIEKLNPDYILVSTLRNINIIDYFENKVFKNSKLKVRPFISKNLWQTLKEIWLG